MRRGSRARLPLGGKQWCEQWLRAQGLVPRWTLCHVPWAITLAVGSSAWAGPTWLEATRACAQALGLPLAQLPAAASAS